MEPTHEQIELWYHYEEIAMHFNQLILQYRLQLMGGAGAIGAISSYLIGANVSDIGKRYWLRFLIASGLFVILCAAAALDVLYYNELLQGAVDALIEYERLHPGINMSTYIEKRFSAYPAGGRMPIYLTYGILLVPLFLFVIWSACMYFTKKT
ncbi:MAG: hypothetical protein IPH73_00520 [Rhodocyclales bacterium]|nr:hypothetical protein [Rhodocyclales bacterium]